MREDLVVGKQYGELTLFSEMAKRRGRTFTIKRLNSEAETFGLGYFWSKEMLIKQEESNMEFTKKDLKTGIQKNKQPG